LLQPSPTSLTFRPELPSRRVLIVVPSCRSWACAARGGDPNPIAAAGEAPIASTFGGAFTVQQA